MKHIVAVSGGKDSTALALRLREVEPREYTYICTPTGNELPEMEAHWSRLEELLETPLTRLVNGTLESWIAQFKALPNWRQRWCTRLLKIVPCIEYVKANQPATLYVGLRADEEEREGIYSKDVVSRFPLREWGWNIKEVKDYVKSRQVVVPERTDCAWCYGQRLVEWKRLLTRYPEKYAVAEELEKQIGNTFRSPGRDTWPASLELLRKEFESGRKVRGEDADGDNESCRVCRI